jgi:hypothetical protein
MIVDQLSDIDVGTKVYVFGSFVENGKAMVATKIMVANKSKLTRKSAR